MTKLARLGLTFAAGLALFTSAVTAAEVKVGFLGLVDDVRYHPVVAYTRIQISPALNPVEGARFGLDYVKIVTDAVGLNITLDELQATDANDAVAKLQAMAAAGERFAILDLPGDVVAQVAPAVANLKLTLLNATAPQDALRALCLPTLMHTSASDRMLADSYTQFLRHRNWTKILLLYGQEPRDVEMANAFIESANRLRLNIVDKREFTLSTDPANRDENNAALITGGADYDVIYIADSLGEYSRSLPYATQLPRPIIGSTGLTADEWHWSWPGDGGTQVTLAFQRMAEGNRVMSSPDWGTWIAAKSIATAYAKARSDDPEKVDAYLKGTRFGVDGSKGVKLSFRQWDRQLRTPIILHTSDAAIEVAPFPEFLHQTDVLDTLGTDQPESPCKAP